MNHVDRYWAQFAAAIPAGQTKPDRYVEAFFFGAKSHRAHEISPLVINGTKTATGTLLWSIEFDGKQPARSGDFWIVTHGGDNPQCIIQTTDVRVLPFDEVGEEYARWGGEGDRTLDSWRHLYWSYIEGECERIGRLPEPKAPLVMERFRVVYAKPLG